MFQQKTVEGKEAIRKCFKIRDFHYFLSDLPLTALSSYLISLLFRLRPWRRESWRTIRLVDMLHDARNNGVPLLFSPPIDLSNRLKFHIQTPTPFVQEENMIKYMTDYFFTSLIDCCTCGKKDIYP
ncbi:0d19ceda-c302-4f78-84e3-ba3bb06ddcc1 [Sclerotinia trifoliorum]|uniref:0d19ceda-c302-4f78-84e3-ba3bb06ddcc1 n=1 Tax=Sclerotinia trifoliorum TaxID=28548 RepID=A0A8H2ZPA2_9HELO|nr:0d19ceda-c302-4f78-84e3-ba3bb06ddcc1 [Sclerotinia trifoliorum]